MNILLPGDPKKSKLKRLVKMVFSIEGIFAIFLFPLTSGVYTGLPISIVKLAFVASVLLAVTKIFRGQINLGKLPWFYICIFLVFCTFIVFRDWPLRYGYPAKKAQIFATYTAWAFLGAILILDGRERVVRFLMTSVWIAAVLGGLGLLGFVTGYQVLYDPEAYSSSRAAVGIGNPIILARAASASILVLAWVFLQADRKGNNIPTLLSFLVYFAIIVVASGSRAPVLACVVAGGFLFVCASFSPKAASRSFQLAIAVLLAGVLLTAVVSNTEKFDKVVDRLGELVTDGVNTTTFEYRRDSWEVAYDMTCESPAIGHGLGSFKYKNFATDPRFPFQKKYPHNVVWELLSESGGIGFLLFGLLHIPVLKLVISRQKSGDYFATSLAAVVFSFWFFCFINAMSSGDLNDNRVLFCMLGLTASVSNWAASTERKGMIYLHPTVQSSRAA